MTADTTGASLAPMGNGRARRLFQRLDGSRLEGRLGGEGSREDPCGGFRLTFHECKSVRLSWTILISS